MNGRAVSSSLKLTSFVFGVRRVPAWLDGPYPAASLIALTLITGVDAGTSPGPREPAFVLSLFGLLMGLGTLHGVAWQLLQALVKRLPRPIAIAFWPLFSLLLGLGLADRLGAFTRLDGRHHKRALAVLAASCGGGAVLGAFLLSLQPTRRAPLGWLPGRGRAVRLGVALVLLALAAGAGVADRRLFTDLYPDAHLAVRVCMLWVATAAFALCDRELRLPRLSWIAALVILALSVLPAALLDEYDTRALQAYGVRVWPSMVLRAARTLTDFDGDGHSSLLGGGDCAPFNPRVHPTAREIPNNGVDDNCLMGDAQPVSAEVENLPVPAEPSPMDIVLITIDSWRPDRLGVYNPRYRQPDRRTTPNLDRWAQRATVFRRAYTPGGWTSVALPSLMHGLFPRRLRWTYFYETNYYAMLRKPLEPQLRPGETPERIYPLAFDDARPPLAERLKRRGMYTAAIVDDGSSQIFQRSSGAATGFVSYTEIDLQPATTRRGDPGMVDLALERMARVPKKQRFFLWVHLFGVHGPDEYHAGAPMFGDTASDYYDHEVAANDMELGRLLQAIEARPSPVAVFITADHGEDLRSNPRSHGFSLDDVVIRVPLLARVPGWPSRQVGEAVSLVDLVPTILALTRTPAPRLLDGRDLAPLANGVPQPPRVLLTDTWQLDIKARKNLESVAAYDGRNKVVYDRKKNMMLVHERETLGDDDKGRLEAQTIDALSRAIHGYLEETGGDLQTRE